MILKQLQGILQFLKQSEIKVIIGKVGFQISHYRSVERWPSCMSGGQVAISYIIALLLNNTRSNRRWNAVKIMCEYRKSPRRSWLKRKNTFWHSYCVMRFPVSKQTVNYIIM